MKLKGSVKIANALLNDYTLKFLFLGLRQFFDETLISKSVPLSLKSLGVSFISGFVLDFGAFACGHSKIIAWRKILTFLKNTQSVFNHLHLRIKSKKTLFDKKD